MRVLSLERFGFGRAAVGTIVAGATLHHEPGAIVTDVGDDRLAAVQSHRVIEAYGKHEVDNGTGGDPEGLELQEDARGRQVPCPAATNLAARY